MHTPKWFSDGQVVISTAGTCGINKDGHELYIVDAKTGRRSTTIDDQLGADVLAILAGKETPTVQKVPVSTVKKRGIAVPAYYDTRYDKHLKSFVDAKYPKFGVATIGDLVVNHALEVRKGHGSPSLDLRTGEIPYLKVSDLRAGSVNINPTNRVSRVVAEKFWKGKSSGLQAFDLICPERASKNIGDFCVLMPGQEGIVLTKEVLVMRPGAKASFDWSYLLWALSLTVVRQQWDRVVLMQTNREDVGKRYLEIELPVPPDRATADTVAAAFKDYYGGMARLRKVFTASLDSGGDHHFFLGEG